MYTSTKCRATSSNWRRVWISEELKAFGAKMCEFRNDVVKLFSSVCTPGVYKMMFHLLDHFFEDVRRFLDISVADAFVYEQFNVHITKSYRCLSRMRAPRR